MSQTTTAAASKEIENAFTYVATQKHIPWTYLETGCVEHDFEMAELLWNHKRLLTKQVWAFGELRAADTGIRWRSHVAPLIEIDGRRMVIDPSLFAYPVELSTWLEILGQKDCVEGDPEGMSVDGHPDPACVYLVSTRLASQLESIEQIRLNRQRFKELK